MVFVRTIEGNTGAVGDLAGRQQPGRLVHRARAVHQRGLNRIPPRTVAGLQTTEDPDPLTSPFDPLVMRPEPAPDLVVDVPAGGIPDEQPGRFSTRRPPSLHQARNCVVTALTGHPSTKRSSTSSAAGR